MEKQETYQDFEPSYQQPTEVDLKNANLQDWVFHYNIFTHLWNAIPRELYQQYWNNADLPGIIKSKELTTVVDLALRVSYDPTYLEKL